MSQNNPALLGLSKQMEDLSLADFKATLPPLGKSSMICSGKTRDQMSKSTKEISSHQPLSELPPPAAQDLPIDTNPPTREESLLAIRQMKKNKAAGLDSAITAEAL